jgi:hypothetical protein
MHAWEGSPCPSSASHRQHPLRRCGAREKGSHSAPGVVSHGTEGVGSRFQVLRSWTHFWQYRGYRVLFSCFALADSFSAIPRASAPILMFCAPGLVFKGTEGVSSRIHVLYSRTRFRRYRGRRLLSSCFARPDSFSAVLRASGPFFMFCAARIIFGGTEGIRSRFHVWSARTRLPQYRGRRVPFSSFALPDACSTVPRASGPVFMFCAPELIFGGTEGVVSRFHVLHTQTRF